MSWEKFIEEIQKRLQDAVSEEEIVRIQYIPKNNGVFLVGVCITKKGGKITPTIYLEEFYENYERGMGISQIVDIILRKNESLHCGNEIDVDFFTDYEQVKERIVFRLVNLQRNKERLQEMPYMEYLDLAIVFYCHVSMEAECHAAIPITLRHMKMWNVKKGELWRMANKNTQKLFPCHLISMQNMIEEMMGEFDMEEQEAELSVPMYILTNVYKLNGATVILYKNVLEDFAKACNGDFYLLPSSIHEVILIPARECSSLDEMNQMVQEVNETQVEEEELLADHAYYYSKKQQKLMISSMEL